MNSRLASIVRKEFIQLFRDRRMLALILVIPLVQLFLLGYASNTDLRDVPMAVFDQSHSAAARSPPSLRPDRRTPSRRRCSPGERRSG